MGIIISSTTKSFDLGGFGLKHIRSKITELVGPEIKQHYTELERELYHSLHPYSGRSKTELLQEYDRKTEKLVKKYKDKEPIFNFLYAPKLCAVFSVEECQCIWEAIKDCEDTSDEFTGFKGN